MRNQSYDPVLRVLLCILLHLTMESHCQVSQEHYIVRLYHALYKDIPGTFIVEREGCIVRARGFRPLPL